MGLQRIKHKTGVVLAATELLVKSPETPARPYLPALSR
jgi:hypothetical protein